jgi:predicted ribosome quality control (RQC) complex YloA/Tae2 family protein
MLTVAIFIKSLDQSITYHIGKNAQENYDIIDSAKADDIWFHVNNRPSNHVIAEMPEDIDRSQIRYIVKQGAVLCKQYSKYSSEKNVDIIWTRVKNVSKSGALGSVITTDTKNVAI